MPMKESIVVVLVSQDLEETGGVQHYGPYIAMDEEDYRLWLQIELSAVEVEMNAGTSDFLFLESVKRGSLTVTWKPKSVLVLVPAEYLQKEDMEANATANSDKHHIAINMDHLMRRTQGETTITSQDNLNRAPEVGNTNRSANQQEDSWQSANDKQVADSGRGSLRTTTGAHLHGDGPVALICIGRWKGGSQSATDKEAIECGWKSCLMNFVASTTLIVGVFHMQERPTQECIASFVLALILIVGVHGCTAGGPHCSYYIFSSGCDMHLEKEGGFSAVQDCWALVDLTGGVILPVFAKPMHLQNGSPKRSHGYVLYWGHIKIK
ncbi:hypothetical protein QJS10_CPA09g01067 [Acorus calamus]|uniref:Uncharacterized protein n=1 Tax=Acorus calamus TaxID=4465 RepID=A0AAV9E662_ACOCL|nr:hypothetical protein QJS10_CPA09g01067 [Acorus calamus]